MDFFFKVSSHSEFPKFNENGKLAHRCKGSPADAGANSHATLYVTLAVNVGTAAWDTVRGAGAGWPVFSQAEQHCSVGSFPLLPVGTSL